MSSDPPHNMTPADSHSVDPDAPARSSRVSDSSMPSAPSGPIERARRHAPQFAQTRMQAWEAVEHARHTLQRLQGQYETAIARGDQDLADALSPELFAADEAFRKAERKLESFGPFGGKRVALAASEGANAGCWVGVMLFIFAFWPMLLGIIIFVLILFLIALMLLLGIQ